ncbi:hypothetical protein JTB14_019339 [Gonioctena quinquepunctata]|nr:hypothetical protein JTB14_019339 [Gonioctena quinquepunctata]
MNRLLVADATKRITVKELVVHPWITERGKRMIRTNPFKSMDPVYKDRINGEISTLLQIDPRTVAQAVSQESLGKIGGMFNILQRRYQMSQLTGDGVTRVLPSLTLLELADLTKNIGKEKKLATARPSSQRKPQTAGRTTDFCTPRLIRMDNLKPVMSSPTEQIMKSKFQTKSKKKDQPIPRPRPNTVQSVPNQPKTRPLPDYRAIKSPTLRRKAYSATITPKTNRTYSSGGETSLKNRPPTTGEAAVRETTVKSRPSPTGETMFRGESSKQGESAKILETLMRPKKDITELTQLNGMRKLGSPLGGRPVGREDYSKHRSTPQDYTRCKSEESRKRPVTGVLQQVFDRALKNTGVTLSQSIPKASEKPVQIGHVRGLLHKPEITSKHWERSPLAFGDTTSRVMTAPHAQRKHAIYDPIARSIADYVTNNVPEKLHHFPWFNKK